MPDASPGQSLPVTAEALNEQGLTFARQGRFEEARARFRDALRLRPDYAAAYNNLGNACKRLGQIDEAEQAMLRAISIDPLDADLHLNLGMLHEQQGDRAAALINYQNAVRVQPQRTDVYQSLARLLGESGRTAQAAEALRQALALQPNDKATANELGNQLQELNRYEDAKVAYRKALQIDPNFAPAHGNLAYILTDEGHTEEARRHYAEALRLMPSPRMRVAAETKLPPIYMSRAEIDASRQLLADNLRRLEEDGIRLDPTREIFPTLFYLAYQGYNDRQFHEALGRLGRGMELERQGDKETRRLGDKETRRQGDKETRRQGDRETRRQGDRLHVGFLSQHFCNHTIGNLAAGIIEKLDRKAFTVTVLSVKPYDDLMGRRIRQGADRYVIIPANPPGALEVIRRQELDILYYTDIGMDPFTYTLAFSRLAPVQCVTWGHPATTGLPTIDYFISSEDLDTPEADSHYTEKLIRLKTPAVYYERPAPRFQAGVRERGVSRETFGLPDDAHLYACPQTLFKFHPDFDEVLAAILRQDPRGLLVLIEGRYPNWRELVWRRFGTTMPDVRERIRFVPRLGRPEFLNLLAMTDVMLDPLHFGGGNSSYEGLALGVPIVTLPSAFLRGRITYALYRKMGLMDCVVGTPEEYVRVAVSLGSDLSARQELGQRIRSASDVLFEDQAAVRELEDFFKQVAGS